MASDEAPPVSARALAEVLQQASMRLDEAMSQLKDAGVPIDQLIRRPSALEDNNSGCNTACSCGGGGGGGGGGNCVVLEA